MAAAGICETACLDRRRCRERVYYGICGEVRSGVRWFDCTPLWSGLARVPWVLSGGALATGLRTHTHQKLRRADA